MENKKALRQKSSQIPAQFLPGEMHLGTGRIIAATKSSENNFFLLTKSEIDSCPWQVWFYPASNSRARAWSFESKSEAFEKFVSFI